MDASQVTGHKGNDHRPEGTDSCELSNLHRENPKETGRIIADRERTNLLERGKLLFLAIAIPRSEERCKPVMRNRSKNYRNGEVPRNRNFREGDRTPKGPDSENGPRGPRNDDGRRGPRRDGDRPFRGDRDRNGGDGEGKPPRRETRERRDFQERPEFPREGGENGEVRQERRTNGPPMGRTKGVGRGGGPGRNFDSRGKREFDRKSGSDKT